MSQNKTPRPDLIPPSCTHPDACQCEIIESTKLVEVEIPAFIATHGTETAELPTGAQARDWLTDRHQEAQKLPVDVGEAAADVTVSDVEGVPS